MRLDVVAAVVRDVVVLSGGRYCMEHKRREG